MWAILWLGAGGGGSAIAVGYFNFFWNLGLFKVEVIAHLRIKLTHHRLKSHFELHRPGPPHRGSGSLAGWNWPGTQAASAAAIAAASLND